jgi:hypothetical protein
MKLYRWTVPALVITFVFPSLPARADAPKVARARPDNGAMTVDPATREVRVVFDQAMDLGGFIRALPNCVTSRVLEDKAMVHASEDSGRADRSAQDEPAS